MACSGVSVLRELSAQFLECGICSDTFKDPRDLKCMHTFCLQCVKFLSEDQPRDVKTVVCPSCKTPTDIPDGGITALSRNRILETLLEKITSHTEKLLQNSCSKHEGRELALFCRKCDTAICHVCAVENHPKPEHEYVSLTTVVKEHREGCNEHLRNIADEIVRDERNLKTARRKSALLREKKDEVESHIRAAAEDVMQLIKIREQELGEELDCVLETREDEIAIFCRALEKKLKDNRKMMDEIRKVLERGDDSAVVKKFGEIREKNAHRIPLAPDGLRFVTFKRDEESTVRADNLGCLKEVVIPWNDVMNENVVLNGGGSGGGSNNADTTNQLGENKGKKEKSEKEANEKVQNNKDSGKVKKVHPSQLPPTPPVSPRTSGVFTIGPAQVFLKSPSGGVNVGGGSGGGGGGNSGGGKQTLSPSSDIFGNKHHHRNPKETRKGIRIVDPNSNQDITELIMGDKNRISSQKVKKRGQQQQQQRQHQQKQQQQQQTQQQQELQQQQQQELIKPEG